MMMNDLLQIQNEMKSPKGRTRPRHADNEVLDDDVSDDQYHWLGLPVNYSPYHPGYTTNHWLMVFRSTA